MQRIIKPFFIAVIILIYPLSVQAAEYHAQWCGIEHPPVSYDSAKVVGQPGQKIALYVNPSGLIRSHRKGCPCVDPGLCMVNKLSLDAGDQVITLFKYKEFTQISYLNHQGNQDSGWVRTQDLSSILFKKELSSADWIGYWGNAYYGINIRKVSKAIEVSVSRPGLNFPHILEVTGNPSDNYMKAIATRSGAHDEWDCAMELHLLGNFLIVESNAMCKIPSDGLYEKNKNFSANQPVG